MFKSPQEALAASMEQTIRSISGFFANKKATEQQQAFQAEQNKLDRQQNQNQFDQQLRSQQDSQYRGVLLQQIQGLQDNIAKLDQNDPNLPKYQETLTKLQGGLSMTGQSLADFVAGGATVTTQQTQTSQGQSASFDVVTPTMLGGAGVPSQETRNITATPTVELTMPVTEKAGAIAAQAGVAATAAETGREEAAKDADLARQKDVTQFEHGLNLDTLGKQQGFAALTQKIQIAADKDNLTYKTMADFTMQLKQQGFAADQAEADRALQKWATEQGIEVDMKQLKLEQDKFEWDQKAFDVGWDRVKYDKRIEVLQKQAENLATLEATNPELAARQRVKIQDDLNWLNENGLLDDEDLATINIVSTSANPFTVAQIQNLQANTEGTTFQTGMSKQLFPLQLNEYTTQAVDAAIKDGSVNKIKGLKALYEAGALGEDAMASLSALGDEGWDKAIADAEQTRSSDKEMVQNQLDLAALAITNGEITNLKTAGELGLSISDGFSTVEEFGTWVEDNFSPKQVAKMKEDGTFQLMESQVGAGIEAKNMGEKEAALSYLATSIPEDPAALAEWQSAWGQLVQDRFKDDPQLMSAYMSVATGLQDQSRYAFSKLQLDLLQSQANIENTNASTSLMRANEAQTWAQTGKINKEASLLSSGPGGPNFDDAMKKLEFQRSLSDKAWEDSGCAPSDNDGMMPEAGADGKSCVTYYKANRDQELADMDYVASQISGGLPPNATSEAVQFTSAFPEMQGNAAIASKAFAEWKADPENFDPTPHYKELEAIDIADREESAAALNSVWYSTPALPGTPQYNIQKTWGFLANTVDQWKANYPGVFPEASDRVNSQTQPIVPISGEQ